MSEQIPLGPIGVQLMEALAKQTPEEKRQMGRVLSGEAANDLLRRGDIEEAVRDLRCKAAGDYAYQRALTDVGRIMSACAIRGEHRNHGCYGKDQDA